MAAKAAWMAVAKSDDFERAVKKYNFFARLTGVKTSVSPKQIIEVLENNTLFGRTGGGSAAVWSPNDLNFSWWIQGAHPTAGRNWTGTTGRSAAIHELLHMGAMINKVEDQIAAAPFLGSKFVTYTFALAGPYTRHEVAVQLSSTLSTGIPMAIGFVAQPIVIGGFGVGGAYMMWANWQAEKKRQNEQREENARLKAKWAGRSHSQP
jgi:hypothetical protein